MRFLLRRVRQTEKIDQQLGKLGQEIAMTEKSLQVQKRIAAVQDKQIEAVFKQAVETAKITREKNIQEGKERLSNELNKEKTEILKGQTSEIAKQNAALQQQALAVRSLDIGGPERSGTFKGVSRTDLPPEINEAIKGSTLTGISGMSYNLRVKEQNRMMEEARLSAEALKEFEDQMSNTNRSFNEIMTSLRSSFGEEATGYIGDYAKEMYEKTKGLSDATGKALNVMNQKVDEAASYAASAQSAARSSNAMFGGETMSTRYLAQGAYVNPAQRGLLLVKAQRVSTSSLKARCMRQCNALDAVNVVSPLCRLARALA